MPDRDPDAPSHARLCTALIWAGLGLAPVAALVALLGGGGGSLRFAVLLTAVCVVLIGASLLIRDQGALAADPGEQAEALRGEIAASARATGQRVQALQDEMTRMRAAGSPAAAPMAARAAVAPPGGNRPDSARPGLPPPPMAEPGHSTGGRPGVAPAGQPVPAVATASVAPPVAHTSVARIAPVAPVTGTAAVGAASVDFGIAAPAPIGAAGFPRQRGAAAVPPAGGGHQGEYVSGTPAAGTYGPGLSGSAWAERSAAVEYGAPGTYAAAEEPPAEPRPSRRHAAPDTGTDLARYGLGAPEPEDYPDYGTYPAAPGAGYAQPAYDRTGDASWAGHDDYAETSVPEQPAAGGFGSKPSDFFAESETSGYLPEADYPQHHGQPDYDGGVPHQTDGYGRPISNGQGTGYGQPPPGPAQPGTYGRPAVVPEAEQYDPDPTAPEHGWTPRDQEQPGRW